MLKTVRSYEEACRTFRWRLPERYNLAFDVCDRQTMAGADGHRTALIVEAADGSVERYTFHVLRLLSNRLANVLTANGVDVGDRVLVSFGPSVEAAVSLLAVLKIGAVAVPAPADLGEIPLQWRMFDSGAVAALVDGAVAPRLVAAVKNALGFTVMLATEPPCDGAQDFWAALEGAADAFAPVVAGIDDPAFLFYPIHGSGEPAGILHAHRVLLGNLPTVEFALGLFPQFGDICWSPAEWMSFDGLIWSLFPAWHHGVPVVAGPANMEPEQALALAGRHGVRVVWAPPYHLARLTAAAASHPHPQLRALATGPETLTAEAHDQVLRLFAAQAHEIWGGPETGAVAANNAALMELRVGSPGRASPGVSVEAVDRRGRLLPAGERGVLAVSPKVPGAFLRYWGDAPGRAQMLSNGWLVSGQLGGRDLDGYLWPEPLAVEEGVVTLNGRRVALDEIQAALAEHPMVESAGVLLTEWGELKAFVTLTPGGARHSGLGRELQAWVTLRRGVNETPSRIDFSETLPLSADGVLQRDELAARPMRLDGPMADERLLLSESGGG